MVLNAFSSVVLGPGENTNGAPAPLAVLVAPDDPLRAELLAAVARGAMVSERA
jgi:hypothetical protein